MSNFTEFLRAVENVSMDGPRIEEVTKFLNALVERDVIHREDHYESLMYGANNVSVVVTNSFTGFKYLLRLYIPRRNDNSGTRFLNENRQRAILQNFATLLVTNYVEIDGIKHLYGLVSLEKGTTFREYIRNETVPWKRKERALAFIFVRLIFAFDKGIVHFDPHADNFLIDDQGPNPYHIEIGHPNIQVIDLGAPIPAKSDYNSVRNGIELLELVAETLKENITELRDFLHPVLFEIILALSELKSGERPRLRKLYADQKENNPTIPIDKLLEYSLVLRQVFGALMLRHHKLMAIHDSINGEYVFDKYNLMFLSPRLMYADFLQTPFGEEAVNNYLANYKSQDKDKTDFLDELHSYNNYIVAKYGYSFEEYLVWSSQVMHGSEILPPMWEYEAASYNDADTTKS
ncbi:hypothetical protein [Weissella confusa]|uniref:hypothetical protein n=1 Tax=Weissella confusa TaxID=1583 RepID=UPI001080C46D|nr:hypothetical protein [Weissella confusa]MCT0014393.1 hypothetical protein [Weissella confusa]MDA5459010.1 hypothetical protein [Weissella confusa]TGE55904.1 hypothetical protein C6P21_11015 [Weissella confusa]